MREESGGWHKVAAEVDCEAGQPLGVRLGDQQVVLVRYEGRVHALDGVCPHAYALLSEGYLSGEAIECPLHAACFDIRTGKLIEGPPGTADLATYDVRVDGGEIWLPGRKTG